MEEQELTDPAVLEFISKLEACETEDAIDGLCRKECVLIYVKYPGYTKLHRSIFNKRGEILKKVFGKTL